MNKRFFSFAALAAILLGGSLCLPVQAERAIQVEVDGRQIWFDQEPIMENDRVLVPVRALAEALGAEITWQGESQKVLSVKEDERLTLQIGSYVMWKNSQAVQLDVAPKLVNDRTLVPVRAVSEGYDAQVEWDSAARKVIVRTNSTSGDGESGQTGQDSFAYQVLELTNQQRINAGLSPLAWSEELAAVAAAHSRDMALRGFFDHTNPDGLSPFDRMKQAGLSYRRAAENIAAGQRTPEEVVNGWMNSAGHRANILNPQLTHLGVGYYAGGSYGTYWTQCFMTP